LHCAELGRSIVGDEAANGEAEWDVRAGPVRAVNSAVVLCWCGGLRREFIALLGGAALVV